MKNILRPPKAGHNQCVSIPIAMEHDEHLSLESTSYAWGGGNKPFRARTLLVGFMRAESAVMGRRRGWLGVDMSIITTLFCGDVSRTQMYLSDSMVTCVNVTNCWFMPKLVSCIATRKRAQITPFPHSPNQISQRPSQSHLPGSQILELPLTTSTKTHAKPSESHLKTLIPPSLHLSTLLGVRSTNFTLHSHNPQKLPKTPKIILKRFASQKSYERSPTSKKAPKEKRDDEKYR